MNKRTGCLSLLIFITITLTHTRTFAATEKPLTASQIASLAVLGKAWGFLKYYHPNVAKGQYNWDSVLIAKIPVFLSAQNPKELNDCMLNWLNELGQPGACTSCNNSLSNRLTWNFDTAWISNSGLTSEVTGKLQFIMANRNQGDNHYVTYGNSQQIKVINEAAYNGIEFHYPSPAYRLLTLFRYWNIVNYFSPYKYITPKKWNQVLNQFIPAFYEAKDAVQYQFNISKLIAALDDGHNAITGLPQLINHIGEYTRRPFLCSIVEGKAVVTLILNDSLCKSQGIALNDVITTIDGETIEERIKKYSPYIWNGSNSEHTLQSLCSSYLFAGKTGTCVITRLTPKGGTEKLTFKRYAYSMPYNDPPAPPSWKKLPDNIGYIHMGELLRKEANAVMDSLISTKGIIFDLRNYPNNTWPIIAARLCADKFLFGRLTSPDLSYPGLYKYLPEHLAGNENKDPYKGKVILLVNAFTKSHAEHSAMGLQAATKTITIGSATAGADGDITEWIVLPGGFRTRFSGLGVYYPDGTTIQKKGVKIDLICKPTIKAVQHGKDELMEMAIKLIKK